MRFVKFFKFDNYANQETIENRINQEINLHQNCDLIDVKVSESKCTGTYSIYSNTSILMIFEERTLKSSLGPQ